jgi:hypothetical protein
MRTKKAPLTPQVLLTRVLLAAVVAYVGFETLKFAVSLSLAPKMVACMQVENKPPAPMSEAQMRAMMTGIVDCIDAKSNFVERLFFDRDEVVASMEMEGVAD